MPEESPWELMAVVMKERFTVEAFTTNWIVRCTRCSAGWMLARPCSGITADPASFIAILTHADAHIERERRRAIH